MERGKSVKALVVINKPACTNPLPFPIISAWVAISRGGTMLNCCSLKSFPLSLSLFGILKPRYSGWAFRHAMEQHWLISFYSTMHISFFFEDALWQHPTKVQFTQLDYSSFFPPSPGLSILPKALQKFEQSFHPSCCHSLSSQVEVITVQPNTLIHAKQVLNSWPVILPLASTLNGVQHSHCNMRRLVSWTL